jgi:cyclopropane-fatty-acyl-phospholipid synthase
MAEHFFRGGLMPAADLLPKFQDHLALEERWLLSGEHYQRTAEAWLHNLDRTGSTVERVFEQAYGAESAPSWYQRWRIFFMACAELFGAQAGEQWMVAHYLFGPSRHDGALVRYS